MFSAKVTKDVNRLYLRILVVVANSMGHPFLIGFLLRKPRPASQAENDGEKDQSMQGARDYEREPHAEVVDLGISQLASLG